MADLFALISKLWRGCKACGLNFLWTLHPHHPVPKLIPHLSLFSVRAERTSNGDLWCTVCLWVNISGVGDCQQAERTSCGTACTQHAEGLCWGGEGCSDLCLRRVLRGKCKHLYRGFKYEDSSVQMFSFWCRNISDQVSFWFGVFILLLQNMYNCLGFVFFHLNGSSSLFIHHIIIWILYLFIWNTSRK